MDASVDSRVGRPHDEAARPVSPDDWARRLSGPPEISSHSGLWPTALLRRWSGTSPLMEQPPLDHHYVVQHLGGPKRISRKRDGADVSTVAACGSLTIVPAGTRFTWRTAGPIRFAHLYFSPALLGAVAARFDRGREFSLIDRVGVRDPLLESLYAAMLEGTARPTSAPAFYLDALLDAFLVRILATHTTARVKPARPPEVLPRFRAQRVADFIEENLDRPLSVAELADLAGTSLSHFSRAFRNAVGEPPHRYLQRRRVERAMRLLTDTDLGAAEIAKQSGFHDTDQLGRAFLKQTGTTPSRYRRG